MLVELTKVTCCVPFVDKLSLMSPVGDRFLEVLVSMEEDSWEGSRLDGVDILGIQSSQFFQGAPNKQ